MGTVGMGSQLDYMILEVLSNLDDSVILYSLLAGWKKSGKI